MSRVLSRRGSQRIATFWAVVTVVNGQEGVVRRDTPYGTQPFITDDEALVPELVGLALAMQPGTVLRVVQFMRGRQWPVARVASREVAHDD